jgi:YD repeat-containing protein
VFNSNFDYNPEFDQTHNIGFGAPANSNQLDYTYTRDTGGRLTAVHRQFFEASFFTPKDQTFEYLPNGKLQKETGPDGDKTFNYDARGLLQSLVVVNGNLSETYTFDYDTLGRSAHVTYSDGHVREQKYDAEGRITSRCYKYTSPPQTLCYTATYDPGGNPATMTDPYFGADSFTYDALNRLTQVVHTDHNVVAHIETYTYNEIGALKPNFNVSTVSSVTLDDQRPKLAGGGTADAAVPNALDGKPVTLDAGGRITSLDGVTFKYDYRSRVLGYHAPLGGSDAVDETYGYDALLRRVARVHKLTQNNVTTTTQEYYAFDGGGSISRHRARRDIEHALKSLPHDPRVLLVDAMSDKERALPKLRLAVAAFETERAGLERLPGWGAAEAYLLLARDLLDHADPVGSRDAL